MKIMVLSDDAVPSGYGRISMEVWRRLVKRGIELSVGSIMYDGLLPPQYEGERLPYWVGSLAGHGDWPAKLAAMVNATQPDVVMVIQDATYAEAVYHSGIDWSDKAFVICTPVDGKPVYSKWVDLFKRADGMMTISEFGVQAHAEQGIQSKLLRPGVDSVKLYPLDTETRRTLRAKFGIDDDTFVLATMAMN
ncbi:MAG: hypothetical protein VKJ09_15630, partial [Leptolyngbya sp.]|nr:hypothetical protein [Leptolyngbya sp.]